MFESIYVYAYSVPRKMGGEKIQQQRSWFWRGYRRETLAPAFRKNSHIYMDSGFMAQVSYTSTQRGKDVLELLTLPPPLRSSTKVLVIPNAQQKEASRCDSPRPQDQTLFPHLSLVLPNEVGNVPLGHKAQVLRPASSDKLSNLGHRKHSHIFANYKPCMTFVY